MMDKLRGKSAVLGVRASSVKQGTDGDSPETQIEQLKRFADSHGIVIRKIFTFLESGSKEEQPMQKAIDYCKDPENGIELFLIKSIDRFTRGGSDFYNPLKRQLENCGVALIDAYGIISPEKINTLGHLGFEYPWSVHSPTQKSELLEAERAKDEVRDLMTRMVGAEIRFTQLGYWMREAPYGLDGFKVNTQHGKRIILKEHSVEGRIVTRMFELRAECILGNEQIVEELNKMGYQSRKRVKRSKQDPTKIIGETGGNKLTVKRMLRMLDNPVYAGVLCEKWTNNKPIKAAFKGIVSVELFNKAHRGRLAIIEHEDGTVNIQKRVTRQSVMIHGIRNTEFPYRKFIACPECRKPLLGSASKGKKKYYPAYHCSNHGHYWRKPKQEVEDTIVEFIKRVMIPEDQVDRLVTAVMDEWERRNLAQGQDLTNLELRISELKEEINLTVGKIKALTSPTAIKYIEEELIKLEEQLSSAEAEKAEKEAEKPLDMGRIMKRVRYFLEHLDKLLLQQIDPVKKAQFFGVLFEKMPTFEEIKDGAQRKHF